MSKSLSIVSEAIDLATIHIASPCDQNWEDMHGNERKRLCAQCDKHVHNFAQMTREEISDVVARELHSDEGLCARLYMRHDGTFLTADCEHSLAQKLVRKSKVHYYRSAAIFLVGLSFVAGAILSIVGPQRARDENEEVRAMRVNPSVFQTQILQMRSKAEQADWEAMAAYGGIALDAPYDAYDLQDVASDQTHRRR